MMIKVWISSLIGMLLCGDTDIFPLSQVSYYCKNPPQHHHLKEIIKKVRVKHSFKVIFNLLRHNVCLISGCEFTYLCHKCHTYRSHDICSEVTFLQTQEAQLIQAVCFLFVFFFFLLFHCHSQVSKPFAEGSLPLYKSYRPIFLWLC